MNSSLKFCILACTLTITSCSDDGPTGGDDADTEAPSIARVTQTDFNHIELTFNEEVRRETAQRSRNYSITFQIIPNPVSTIPVDAASLWPDQRTVTLTTGGSVLDRQYDLRVIGVSDLNGNMIEGVRIKSFQGAILFDHTAPKLVYQSPAPDATEVGIGQGIMFRFTETTFVDVLRLASANGDVQFSIHQDDLTYMLTPFPPFLPDTEYTVHIGDAHDEYFNAAPDTSWSFTTGDANDTQAPTLVSSSPAEGAMAVNLDTNVSLTFSEAMTPVALFGLAPYYDDSYVFWSSDGKTLWIDPDQSLTANQQYTITMPPNAATDLAGNGTASIVNIRFTTGSALATGSVAGTIAGDATSAFAHDPVGAIVIASVNQPSFFGPSNAAGTDVLTSDHSYEVDRLPDDSYYSVAYMNTNKDRWLSPYMGDAFGAYGMNIDIGDYDAEILPITGGAHVAGIDFTLYDPSSAFGWIDYEGIYADEELTVHIGLYDTTAFDPQLPPTAVTYAYWPDATYWIITTLDGWSLSGTYFARAFLDVNRNNAFDAGTEPVGIFEGTSPIPLRLESGSDSMHLAITLRDPVSTSTASTRVTWPRPAPGALSPKEVAALMREATMERPLTP